MNLAIFQMFIEYLKTFIHLELPLFHISPIFSMELFFLIYIEMYLQTLNASFSFVLYNENPFSESVTCILTFIAFLLKFNFNHIVNRFINLLVAFFVPC